MQPKNLFLYLFILIFILPVFSQETNLSTEDSTAIERRKQYEETLKRIEEIRRRREKDPERYMDSIRKIKEEERYQEAVDRINQYKASDLSSVKELDLTGARLSQIPDWVYDAERLEILILDYNQIHELPKSLNNLSELKRIYWRYNELGTNRPKIKRQEGIEKLDLTGNGLKKLPKVHRLKDMEELVLENNAFTKIPTWKGRRLKSLRELDLSRNPVVINRRWYWLLKDLEILHLNKCEIEYLHPSLYKMAGLKELLIQVNELSEISKGISALQNLSKISFYKNNLQNLPADLFGLEQLEVIDLYYNELEKIPSDIAKLRSLKILYLSFNSLYDIPDEIGDLSGLEELYIHHNRISEVPQQLEELDSLRVFHFQNNYIPTFPAQVLGMRSLEDLDISDTDISQIPGQINELNLKTFFWRNLDIDLNDPEQFETREALKKLMEQGVNVVPSIAIHESSAD
ncbi:leucine-rich repeat domain-containing protein [Ekhidna sp.]|uniref:leucine-rich repeat domain-containing protein n=1 Tax=Ekhidna sp. TaxID=2608089 RepID=UPI003B58FE4A